MLGEQLIVKGLLAGAWNTRIQPVRIWDFGTADDMYLCGVDDLQGRRHMGDGIKRLETLVYGHLQNRYRGIERAIDRTSFLAVPATTDPIRRFADGRFLDPQAAASVANRRSQFQAGTTGS